MIYDPFSIVVVPFPFSDKAVTKRRPALVVSTRSHQAETGHITLLMITTAKQSAWVSDYAITELNSTGLIIPSIIRQKLFTIDQRLILASLGLLASTDQQAVNNLLKNHLAFEKK